MAPRKGTAACGGKKTCSACLGEYPVSNFAKNKCRSDGLESQCRTCKGARYQLNRVILAAKRADTPAKTAFKNARSRAITRNLPFDLDIDFVLGLFSQKCAYCDGEFRRSESNGGIRLPQNPWAPSLERVDNDKGYTKTNVLPAHIACNKAKLDFTLSQFRQFIAKIHNHLNTEPPNE